MKEFIQKLSLIIIFGIILLGITALIIISFNEPEPDNKKFNETIIHTTLNKPKLEYIIQEIVTETNLGDSGINKSNVCRHYTKFYKEYFEEFYPELRLLKPTRQLNNHSNSSFHTYLIVHGYGTYCILDQTQYWCSNLKNQEYITLNLTTMKLR